MATAARHTSSPGIPGHQYRRDRAWRRRPRAAVRHYRQGSLRGAIPARTAAAGRWIAIAIGDVSDAGAVDTPQSERIAAGRRCEQSESIATPASSATTPLFR